MEDENIVQPEAEKTVEQVEEKIETPVEAAPATEPVAEAPAPQTAPKRRGRKPKAPAAPAEEKPAEAPAEQPATEKADEPAPARKRGRPKKVPAEEKPVEAAPAPAKKRAPRAKKAPAEEKPVEEIVEEEVSKVYTPEETVEIINRAVARKRSEVAAIQKSMSKVKRASSLAEKQALVDYLNADINAYVSVIADMTDDDSLLEDIDSDAAPVEVPENYQKIYLDKLSVDDLENEQEAEELRADYCDGVIEDMCTSIGETALSSKKMLKVLLDDPYALELIGEIVFYDDFLYDQLKALVEDEDKPKKKSKDKSKKSGKKSSKKDKKQKNRS